MMSRIMLRSFDERGLFARPGESEIAYKERIETLLGALPFDALPVANSFHSDAINCLKSHFSISPDWVPVFYSNEGLYPWEGACTWHDTIPTIQLSKRFQKTGTLFGIYSEGEVLAHEYVHAVRACFGDSPYEELFAYLVSNPFRAFFGPIFHKPSEGVWFLVALTTLLFSFAAVTFFEAIFFQILLFIAFSLFLTTSLFFLGRLLLFSLRFRRLKSRISTITSGKPWPLMIRLSGDEIALFTSMNALQIREYIEKRKEKDFRWQMLFTYCKNCPIEAQ